VPRSGRHDEEADEVNRAARLAGGLVAVVVVASWLPDGRSTDVQPVDVRPVEDSDVAAPAATAAPAPATRSAPPSPAVADEGPPLLVAASGGDGDSWRDTAGREYRLGMVNAPETGECFGGQATAERARLVAAGFRPEVYSTDRYGRQVAVVTTADGTNLNVHLARHGFVDDRYLAQFRHENPVLARELDAAFARAKADGAGLWRACGVQQAAPRGIAAAPPASSQAPAAGRSCHPDYVSCVPVKGDGSGRGQANDLDCGDLDGRVQLRRIGTDPYRLDGSDDDGHGCE
jgi:endonuclease YncB( thermonuclease family)